MIKVFEMFSGYGGASFALKKAGINFECVGHSEINRDAIKIFELNHPNIKNYGDCRNINPKELPDFDLLTAGFPCQPFSVNTKDKLRGEGHKSSNLFMDIIRVLEEKKPTYIFLENVKGIKGEKSKSIYEKILYELKRLNYDVRVEVANSKDYGTPQNRERVLFIGKLGGFNKSEYSLPEKEELKLSVRELLDMRSKRREPRIKSMRLSNKNKFKNLDTFGDISRLDAILASPVDKHNSNVAFEILDAPSDVVSRQSDRIYHPTYSPCLTATGTDYLFYVDEAVIVLTPKECFRLMGFFNDEIKLGDIGDSALHKLAGNGWDINTMSKFLSKILGGVDMKEKENVGSDGEIISIIENDSLKNEYKIQLIKYILNKN